MATGVYTELYCDPVNGSNLNAGTQNSAPTMSDTAGTGTWTSTTQIYLSVVTTGAVAIGQYLALYTSGSTVAATIAQITGVTGGSGVIWHITVSNSIYIGTQPSALTTGANYSAQVDGYWLGPNAASPFPFNLANLGTGFGSINPVRVNLKNSATYNITAGLTTAAVGPVTVQGMTTTPNDGGRATIDGGTSTIVLLASSQAIWTWRDLIFQNNGTTLNNNGITVTGARTLLERVTVNTVRGFGISLGASGNECVECEAYACNGSNTAIQGGFTAVANNNGFIRCVSHHNTGTNSSGFILGITCGPLVDCIAAANGLHGFYCQAANAAFLLSGCLGYNNGLSATGHGAQFNGSAPEAILDNCHWILNTGGGVNIGVTGGQFRMINNGDFNNSSGRISTSGAGTTGIVLDTGGVTYGSDPCTDGAHGDFSLVLGSAKNAGRGNFYTTAAGAWTKTTTGYPDIGPVQHLDQTGALGGGTTTIILVDPPGW